VLRQIQADAYPEKHFRLDAHSTA